MMGYMEQQMQQQMEAAEHDYHQLMEEFNPPLDWDNPLWDMAAKCHNWRNYVSDDLTEIWSTFTGRQQIILSSNFQEIADKEDWD